MSMKEMRMVDAITREERYHYHGVTEDTTVAEIAQVTHLTAGEIRTFLQDVVDSQGEALTDYAKWAEENA